MPSIFRELIRLILANELNNSEIAEALHFARNTVRRYRRRLHELSLEFSEVCTLDDETLLNLINNGRENCRKPFVEPDWDLVDRELRRAGVTRSLLYQEYRSALPPPGKVMMSEREFFRRLETFRKLLGVSMRQAHNGGEKLFVDFSGKRISYLGEDGQPVMCEVFVATLGASGYTYVEAVRSQKLPDWTMAHVRAFEFFEGSPHILVPDCLKSGVTTWRYVDAVINPTYAELAAHYGAAVIPARPRHPKDKGKVENAVLLAQRWILAALRNRVFFSLAELNEAIARLLKDYNNRPFRRRRDQSRRSLFETLDQPVLRALPFNRYEFGEWRSAKVPSDYHVAWDERNYSVPYTLVGKQVQIRASPSAIKIYHLHQEVATHVRLYDGARDSTEPAHRPAHHRKFDPLDPARIDDHRTWARGIGANVAAVAEAYIGQRESWLITSQKLLALRRLQKDYGADRLEKACLRGLAIGSTSVRMLRSALQTGMEDAPIQGADEPTPPKPPHRNVRGRKYFK